MPEVRVYYYKNNEEEVYICVVTDQNERLREYEFTLYPETGFCTTRLY